MKRYMIIGLFMGILISAFFESLVFAQQAVRPKAAVQTKQPVRTVAQQAPKITPASRAGVNPKGIKVNFSQEMIRRM